MTIDGGRPHILHVTRQFHPNRGGLEDFVANLAREQVRAGWQVEVLTCDRLFVRPDERLPARDELDGIAITRIPHGGSSRYPVAPSLFGHLRRPDLVHVHAVDFFFDAAALSRPLHGRPMVATTHGGFFHTPRHAALKRLWFAGPTRLSASFYDAIAGCSEADVRLFSRIAPGRTHLIENGVDLKKFAGAASPVPVRRLVTLGRFSTNKRLDRVLDVLQRVRARDPSWRLDILGVESDLTRADLLREANARGIAESVSIEVGLDEPAIAARLRQASFFVSASEYEGFGIALIEAMSAGLHPVVHPNASFTDLATRHHAIDLADFAEPETVALRLDSRMQAWTSGTASPRADLSRYGWASVAKRYAGLYATARASRLRPRAGSGAPLPGAALPFDAGRG